MQRKTAKSLPVALLGPLAVLWALPACSEGESVVQKALAAPELQPAKRDALGTPPALQKLPPLPKPLAAAPSETAAKVATPEPKETTTPVVASPETDDSPRLYAKTRFVWIRDRPDWGSPWIGYLWTGGSAKLKTGKPVFSRGCETWYEIEPRGYVCVDGRRATLDGADPGYREVASYHANYDSPTPHHYAESRGAERYNILPDSTFQRMREGDYVFHLREIEAIRNGATPRGNLIGVDLTPAPMDAVAFASLPPDVQMHKHSLKRDSAMAYLGEYQHDGRTFLLTADYAWVPKDRTRPYPPIPFHGLTLGPGKDAELPLAFFRIHDRPAFRRLPDGDFVPVAEQFKRLDWVPLTGKRVTVDNVTYVETKRAELWVREDDAVIPTPPPQTPWGTSMKDPGGKVTTRRTWIEVDVFGGWLIAYEHTVPVFATMISAGRGGVAAPAEDAAKTSSTPIGQFTVTGKFLTATMDGPTDVTHADVPWVQNFSGPHSIHTAYWHDAWGERVSSGCVNVSPKDARWLFEYSEPRVPTGWHSAVWAMEREPSTLVVVHR